MTRVIGLSAVNLYLASVRGEKAFGEASPQYWFYLAAPRHLKHYIPDARHMTVFRHSVDRFYSHYMMYRMLGEKPRSLEHAIENYYKIANQPLRTAQHLYVQIGYYHQHLQRYWQKFPREQVGIWLFEELKEQPTHMLRTIFAFLEVDDTFEPEMDVVYEPSGESKNKLVHWMLKKRWWTNVLLERCLTWRGSASTAASNHCVPLPIGSAVPLGRHITPVNGPENTVIITIFSGMQRRCRPNASRPTGPTPG